MYDHCETLKNSHTVRKVQGMKFLVLWLASVSLSVWVGTEKRGTPRKGLSVLSRITLHFGAKAVKTKIKNWTTERTVERAFEGK